LRRRLSPVLPLYLDIKVYAYNSTAHLQSQYENDKFFSKIGNIFLKIVEKAAAFLKLLFISMFSCKSLGADGKRRGILGCGGVGWPHPKSDLLSVPFPDFNAADFTAYRFGQL
jgi:hypothetical protein